MNDDDGDLSGIGAMIIMMSIVVGGFAWWGLAGWIADLIRT
jgi:hypothetical protein